MLSEDERHDAGIFYLIRIALEVLGESARDNLVDPSLARLFSILFVEALYLNSSVFQRAYEITRRNEGPFQQVEPLFGNIPVKSRRKINRRKLTK